ncbi:MAG: glycerol-3-phosphate 1-O-acyltransferase PlsY [Rhodobacteraceae bacterium]|nr:glycerol-3-phosphate 1-O-acyltransferase PlsY [Paracoccaceae bacterium]MCY4197096.1 glycerol-3-phosphate 1-O-acyltransferase PlsY [Paracoccaceae bacterium]
MLFVQEATIFQLIPVAIVAYLLGSIPFGLLLSRFMGLGDLRKIGSGNIGATNVLRTGSRIAGLLTLLLDAAKGFLPVFIAGTLDMPSALMAALAAFIGHVHPVWLRFRGGKGVATYLGILIALDPLVGLSVGLVWAVAFAILHISSVSSMTAALVAPIATALFVGTQPALVMTVLSLWILIRHHQNIRRLLAGTEPRSVLSRQSSEPK